ncbi:MAG: hypothetical protein VB066_10925 [Paludibacter sp.]|nr:hypothetical protein [Paludibacter sp.]
MSVVLQNLLEITRKRVVSESDLDYFEEHVEDFPDNWGNLYLWSIQSKNYQLSDYLLECGLDLNTCEDVRRDVMKSYSLYGLYSEKIIQDGFEITKDIYHLIINVYSNDQYFDKDRLDNDYNYSLPLSRGKKIDRLINNIHKKRCSVVI